MAWLAVHEDGSPSLFPIYPDRVTTEFGGYWDCDYCEVPISKETMRKLTDKELTWNDNPIRID